VLSLSPIICTTHTDLYYTKYDSDTVPLIIIRGCLKLGGDKSYDFILFSLLPLPNTSKLAFQDVPVQYARRPLQLHYCSLNLTLKGVWRGGVILTS
jgi:hypothetical protein